MRNIFYSLKIAWRKLGRDTFYSTINIGGLAIGMAAAILIFAAIYHEWSYDRFHTKKDNLYLTYCRATSDGALQCWYWTPKPLGPALKTDYPEVTRVARMSETPLPFLFTNGDVKLKVRFGFTDPDFLTMFDFPLMQGDRGTALNEPASVILTEKAAIRLFGREDPMGKTVLFDNQYSMTVTGVMKDLPDNTLFQFEILAPFSFMKTLKGWYDEEWQNHSLQTYVELHPDANLDLVNESICDIIKTHTDFESQTDIFLYPLVNQRLYSNFENGVPAGGAINKLRLFGAIAIITLLIACINFTNLSTARSAKRAKEVGIRRVVGGKRLSLIGLFLGESMVTAFVAGMIALGIALTVLPTFGTLIDQQLTLNLANGWFWVAGLGFVFLTGLLAGSYPAFYLSSFMPLKVLKGVLKTKQSPVSLRKVLVVVQFTVAAILMLATLDVHREMIHAQNKDAGYNKEHLIYVFLEGGADKNYELTKQDLLSSGAVTSVTKTSSPITQVWSSTSGIEWRGGDSDSDIQFDLYFADANWSKTVGTTIIEGRDIDIYTYPTDSNALVLNETAVKIMNFEHPIGEIVSYWGRDWQVVGVVKDFILRSPTEPVLPMLIGGPGGYFNTIHIRLNSQNSTADNLAQAEQIFKKYNPAYPFEYQFVEEEYAHKFHETQKLITIATWFAGLTIFISCMGLFALVAYMAETRKKEIGIRKVFGASVFNIISLLTKEFLILVLIAIAIAFPVTWWAMEKWQIENYAFYTSIPWWLFVVVGFASLAIAFLTVGFQALKAATADPIKSISNSE